MNIGIDARFYGSIGKGLGRYTEKLIAALEKIDHVNDYFIFLRHENYNDYTPQNVHFQKVIADEQWYSWSEQWSFPRTLRKYHLDLVHFPHFNVPLLYRQPFVVTIHDLILLHYPTIKASELPPILYWMKYWMYRIVIASAIRRAAVVFTVSRFTQDDLVRTMKISPKKIVLTPEAADPYCYWLSQEQAQKVLERHALSVTVHSTEQQGGYRRYVLYVGNAYPHKNLELLLRCAHSFPELDFVCVGKEDYFYRLIQKRVIDHGLNNLRFLGFVPDCELGILYRFAAVYLFPSLYEGFGLPALEALNYGLPVLAARRGALPEILGEAGLFFDPTRKDDVLRQLRKILEDVSLREKLRQNGFQQIGHFNWETMAKLTHTAYLRQTQTVRS